jgi:hypothetical protein
MSGGRERVISWRLSQFVFVVVFFYFQRDDRNLSEYIDEKTRMLMC